MPRFRDLPQLTRGASYRVDISWEYLPHHYYRMVNDYGLDVNPNFQRGRVWTTEQKIKYVEYVLMGGRSGKDIYTNCPRWSKVGREYPEDWYVLVDGKQRLDAALGFINNEFPIFGGYYRRDFVDKMDIMTASFYWHVNELPTMEEVYQWYIDLNTGGTPHSPEEIAKVKALLDAGEPYVRPSAEEIRANANLDRQILRDVAAEEAEEAVRRARHQEEPKTKRGRRK